MFDSFTALNGWRPEIQGTIPAPAASSMALNSPSDPASATLTPAEGLRGAGDTTGSVLPPRGIASADELGNPGGAMAGATTGGGLPGAPFVIKSENVYQHFRELF